MSLLGTRARAAAAVCLFAACSAPRSSDDAPSPSAPSPSPERAQQCAAALRALRKEYTRLSTCTNDPECGKPVPTGGSCGCSPDSVVRLDADATKYTALLAEVAKYSELPACAPPVGACTCPEMDGSICTDGRCRWNPLDRSTLCDRTVAEYVGTRRRECAAASPDQCAATLALRDASAVLVRDGVTARGSYQCEDGVMKVWGELAGEASIAADGTISLLGEVFQPVAGAQREPQPAPVEFSGQQDTFRPPSNDVNCIYTAAGGTGVYKPREGGQELSCDRVDRRSYDRVQIGPKGPARVIPHPGDASCCSLVPVVPEGGHIRRGPFSCEVTNGELSCKRADGPGFSVNGKRVRALQD